MNVLHFVAVFWSKQSQEQEGSLGSLIILKTHQKASLQWQGHVTATKPNSEWLDFDNCTLTLHQLLRVCMCKKAAIMTSRTTYWPGRYKKTYRLFGVGDSEETVQFLVPLIRSARVEAKKSKYKTIPVHVYYHLRYDSSYRQTFATICPSAYIIYV
jgi:hypothetical protein